MILLFMLTLYFHWFVQLSRHRGFQEVAEEVNKWEKRVHQLRTATHVQFPLNTGKVSILEADKQFKPLVKTELEQQMYALLTGADMIKPKEVCTYLLLNFSCIFFRLM